MNRSGGVVARVIGRLAGVIRGQRAPDRGPGQAAGSAQGPMDFAAAKRRWGRQHPLGAPLLEVERPPVVTPALSVDAQVSALERMLAARAARQGARR